MLSWLLVPAVGAAWIAAASGIGAALGGRPEGDERHPALTLDGWTLTVHRVVPPPGTPWRHEPPIVLGHGFMMNGACWSLSPEGSLPHALAALGFDVWIAEYRSTDSALPPEGEETPGRWDYALDDIARFDLPAIIETVRAVTGASKVSWVGHSMGGIVVYVYAEAHGCDALHRVVTLGTPVQFAHVGDVLPWGIVPRVSVLTRRLRSTHVRLATQLGLPAVAAWPRAFTHFSGNFENQTRREELTLVRHALQDNAVGLPEWFLDRMRRGDHQSCRAITVPLLVLGGVRDRLAPPAAVQAAFEDARAPIVGAKVYGDDEGEPSFGHADLISSALAVAVVVPDLMAWLAGPEPRIAGGRVKRPGRTCAPMET